MTTSHIRVPLVQPGTVPELAEVESRIMAERGRVSPASHSRRFSPRRS